MAFHALFVRGVIFPDLEGELLLLLLVIAGLEDFERLGHPRLLPALVLLDVTFLALLVSDVGVRRLLTRDSRKDGGHRGRRNRVVCGRRRSRVPQPKTDRREGNRQHQNRRSRPHRALL